MAYVEAHKPENLNGPGDSRPTALQIVEDQGLVNQLGGKVILVTGCSPGGLGVETAKALHATGAHIWFTLRDESKATEVANEIRSDGQSGKVEFLKLDLASLDSVRAAADDFLKRSNQLNIMVNNAAVMACPLGRTKDDFELQFGTNHLGHYLLFQLLKPTLLASATPGFSSRVVSVSSIGHIASEVHFDDYDLQKDGYEPWKSYGQAKTANIYLANEINRRYGSRGLYANSLHPGGIFTPLQRHISKEQMDQWSTPEIHKNMKSPPQGAATSVWAAIGKDLEGRGGLYLDNVAIAGKHPGGPNMFAPGYAEWAFDEEKAKRLWKDSARMVGVAED